MIQRGTSCRSLRRQCTLLGLSRSALYDDAATARARRPDAAGRIDELYLQYPFYGSRQIFAHYLCVVRRVR